MIEFAGQKMTGQSHEGMRSSESEEFCAVVVAGSSNQIGPDELGSDIVRDGSQVRPNKRKTRGTATGKTNSHQNDKGHTEGVADAA